MDDETNKEVINEVKNDISDNDKPVEPKKKKISLSSIFLICIFSLVAVLYIFGYFLFSKDGSKFDFSGAEVENDEENKSDTIINSNVIKYDKSSITIDSNTKYLELVFNENHSYDYICMTSNCDSFVSDGKENIVIYDGEIYLFNYLNLGLRKIKIDNYDINNIKVIYEDGSYVFYVDDDNISCDSIDSNELLNNDRWIGYSTFDEKLNACKSENLTFGYKYKYTSISDILEKSVYFQDKIIEEN